MFFLLSGIWLIVLLLCWVGFVVLYSLCECLFTCLLLVVGLGADVVCLMLVCLLLLMVLIKHDSLVCGTALFGFL